MQVICGTNIKYKQNKSSSHIRKKNIFSQMSSILVLYIIVEIHQSSNSNLFHIRFINDTIKETIKYVNEYLK